MELFVVNRVEDDDTKVTPEEEQAKLDKVLKQIERKKKIRQRQKEREKVKQAIKAKAKEERQHKRQLKSQTIPVPENKLDDFIEPEPEATTTADTEKGTKRKPDIVSLEGFTVLGGESLSKRAKVKRVLPRWLSNPTVISSDLQELKTRASKIKLLNKSIRDRLKSNGITYLFPVQAEVVPWLLEASKVRDVVAPRDICVSAPTGSGKTLAFVLPVVQALSVHTVRKIRALVILPTQDLAAQVFKAFKTYAQDTKLEVCLITGKNSFEHEQKQLVSHNEAFGYYSKVDILVCTAGRLVNHLKSTKGFSLQHLEFLVIDEADRVLESVQNDWLYHLEKHIYADEPDLLRGHALNLLSLRRRRPPQKLLFSATLSQDPEKLEKLSLFQPKLFTSVDENMPNAEDEADTFAGKFTTPRELTEKYIVCSKDLKPLLVYRFIKTENLTKTLVFTHSIESAHRLMILLKSMFKDELKIEEISSSLKGQSRDKLIDKFSQGDIDLLICTDALARGIDLPGVKCVISYSAPKYLKTYIHRAGRTARAGELGLAVTLLHKEQMSQFKSLLDQSKKSNMEELKIPEEDLEPLGKRYKKALNALKETVTNETKADLKKVMSSKIKTRKRYKRPVKETTE